MAFEPARGHRVDDAVERGVDHGATERFGGCGERAGPAAEHVALHLDERIVGALERPLRVEAVVEVERRAVVDEPGAFVPDQQIGVPGGAVDVGDEGIEEHDLRRRQRVGARARDGIVGDAARQVVEAQVQARAAVEGVEDLRVRLGRGERTVELDEDDLGHREAHCPRDLARQELGDQRLLALAGAAQLHDVEAEIVAFDERGDRAAFFERHHVARGRDGADGPSGASGVHGGQRSKG